MPHYSVSGDDKVDAYSCWLCARAINSTPTRTSALTGITP